MPSKSDFITWAIERYISSGGSGLASFSASSVTESKVQIRNDEGDLLEEYDKDFAEYKMGAIAGDSAPNETPRVKPEQVANRSFNRTGENKQEATPKGAKPNLPLALAGLVALIGVIAFAASKIGVNTTTSAPPPSQAETAPPSQVEISNPFRQKEQQRILVRETLPSLCNKDFCIPAGNVFKDPENICLSNTDSSKITKQQFEGMLADGYTVVSASDLIKEERSVSNYWRYTCQYTPYILER